MISKQYDTFIKSIQCKSKMKLSPLIQQQLQFQQTIIKKDFDKNAKDKKKKRVYITEQFVDAFQQLNKTQRIELYCKQVEILNDILNHKYTSEPEDNSKKMEVLTPGGTFRSWKRKVIQINAKERTLTLESQGQIRIHNLSNYIYRKSKNTDYFSFVLEAVNGYPKSKYKTMHFGFTNINQSNIIYEQVKSSIDYSIALSYMSELKMSPAEQKKFQREYTFHKTEGNERNEMVDEKHKLVKDQDVMFVAPAQGDNKSSATNSPKKLSPYKQFSQTESPKKGENDHFEHHQVEDLAQSKIIKKIIHQSIELKNLVEVESDEQTHKNIKPYIMEQLLPNYELQRLLDEQNMTTINFQDNHRVLQNNQNKKHFKIFLTIPSSANKVFSCITNPENMKKWNPEVEELSLKNIIKSENTAVVYMKLKNYSAIYRGRDFFFLRHAFRKGKNLYIVDKSIENIDYPPFVTIVRGQLTIVWGFIENKQSKETLLVVDATIDNEGILNQQQNTNLTLRYLQKVANLQNFVRERTIKGDDFSVQLFDLDWVTEPNFKKNNVMKKNVSQKLEENQSNVQNDNFKSIIFPQKSAQFSKDQIKQEQKQEEKRDKQSDAKSDNSKQNNTPIQILKQLKEEQEKGELDFMRSGETTNLWVPELDSEGMSVTNWKCLSVKHKMSPWPRPIIIDEDFKEHQYWKGEWKHDEESGGLWYKDEVKMNAQKKVLGYIVKKMGSNLLKGKGILSISLPVDVFSLESNLQRVARTFTLCPLLLQKAAKLEDPILQMKQVVIAGLTNSLTYLSMQKPFNPVLGQTFQGSVNGCPIFMQQVSHHPPIAAFYMVGRGYKIHGRLESKMQLSVNSGCGINDGDFVIQFENGTIIKFRTPGGQISGLTFGDRKLNLDGKGYYWSPNKQLMLEVTYNPNKKGIFSFGKQETPSDYFQGHIKKVTKEFIQQFESKKNKIGPNSKDVLEEYCKVYGTWTKQLYFDDKKVFDVDKDKYIKFEYEPNPLPSDANYREDIIYRRLDNVPRSQNEKERIENIQREDRKLREKFTGKKH